MNVKNILNMKIKSPLLIIALFVAFGRLLLYILFFVLPDIFYGDPFHLENYRLLSVSFSPLLAVLPFLGFYRLNEYLYGRVSEEKRLEKRTSLNSIVGNFFISLPTLFYLIGLFRIVMAYEHRIFFKNQFILYCFIFLYLLGIVFLYFSYQKKYQYLIFYPFLFSVSIIIPFFNIGYNFINADTLGELRFAIIVYFIVYSMFYCLLILPNKKIKGQSLKEKIFVRIVILLIVLWTFFSFFFTVYGLPTVA